MPVCLVNETSSWNGLEISSINRTYNLRGYTSREQAEGAFLAQSPQSDIAYPQLSRSSLTVTGDEESVDTQVWIGEATWELQSSPSLQKEIITGSISLGQGTVRTSFRHVGSWDKDGPLGPDAFNGFINASGESVEGASQPEPQLSFTLQKFYPKGTYTIGYQQNAANYVGLPNTAQWRSFGSGTLMLTAVNGSNDGGTYDPISFSFTAKPTLFNVQIPVKGGTITIPQILGYQYLHFDQEEYQPDNAPKIMVPTKAHLDELSKGVDINGLVT